MRGSSVDTLIVLQPDDVPEADEREKHVLLTVQPRLAAGSLAFAEIPAGILDDTGSFCSSAAKEIEERTELAVKDEDLIDLTASALRDGEGREELQEGCFYDSWSL
jgi:ADP-sugar diphosphatase